MKKLLALLLLAGCLAGCTSPMPASPEELLDAPKLSDTQYQVDRALREQMGQDIKLKYPQSGDYRSAFTFYDIDNDGADEAIVLHSYQSGGNAQITVMDQENGQWQVEKTYPGLSPDIDFIRFEQLDSNPGKAMVIGWRPEGGQKIVAAYRYENREFTMLGSEDYTQLCIDDFNQDGISEMLIVSAESDARPTLIYMGEQEGLLDVLDSVNLDRQLVTFQTPVSGLISPGVYGAVLDVYNERGNLCSIVVQVEDGRLVLPLDDGDGVLFSSTIRSGGEASVFSQDVTGDGVIDIPTEWMPAGHEDLEDENRLLFTNYVNLGPGGFTTVMRAFVNPTEGYRLTLPDRWFSGEETVTAIRQSGSAEVIFFLYSEDISDRSRELLRVQLVDLQSPPKQFDASAYFLLAKRGSFEYYARIPASDAAEYSVTQEEVLSLFQLL